MPSKKRRISTGSGSSISPSDQTRSEAPSRSAQPIATTFCRYNGAKSPPVAARRCAPYHASTSASVSAEGTSWMRRMPAASGTVSISKTRIGIIPSGGENAGRQIAIAAIAHDEHDRRVFDFACDPQCDLACAARGDPAKEALFAREPPRHVFGERLRHVLDAIDARRIEDLRQVGGRP